jgi:hypothetical protein
VAATISSAEAARLSKNHAVRAIVADEPVTLPPRAIRSPVLGLTSTPRRAASCPGNHKPLLEPEALQLTNTAFSNAKTPQARSTVNGKGVTVAFLADGLDVSNPDFMRSSGNHVITNYKDFTGSGTSVITGGGEAFGDASSIAAQGRQVYNADAYVSVAQSQSKSCLPIRILGMAPGANMMALQVFGPSGGDEAICVAAVQYAVAHGANVINESLSWFRNPDSGLDPLELANDAAVSTGVTVVGISWDAGTAAGTMFPPGTDPNIITAGASTQFQAYKQVSVAGSQLFKGAYVSDNISAISSSGVSDDGRKTVDVVAPGDQGWALCTPDLAKYYECSDFNGRPSSVQLFGGTSEAAPLTAGEAALVIEAYRNSHGGVSPSPALVKQIIMSTATDLNAPASEQGAGLINSLKAVQAAESIGKKSRLGAGLLLSPSDLVSAPSGRKARFSFQVTNDGSRTVTVSPVLRELASPFARQSFSPVVGPTDPTFVDWYGFNARYVKQTFAVPKGTQRLDAAIAWNVASEPSNWVEFSLFDPHGDIAGYNIPQDSGPPVTFTGYGHIGIHDPTPGKWTALIWTSAGNPYHGTVHLSTSESKLMHLGSLSPGSRKLSPGQTGTFKATLAAPFPSGDEEPQVLVAGRAANGAQVQAGAIPILLRSLVPISGNGGIFSGVLTGGNGRAGRGDAVVYDFKLPGGLRDVDLNVRLADSGYNLEGILIDPRGNPLDIQSTITRETSQGLPAAYTNSMQFFWRSPAAGTWRFLIFVNDSISGAQTSEPFKGTLTFNKINVHAVGVPDSPAVHIHAGSSLQATVVVKNTGTVAESYFVDPRLAQSSSLQLGASTFVLRGIGFPTFVVPPLTTRLTSTVVSSSPSIPVSDETTDYTGAPPSGYLYTPRVDGSPTTNRAGNHESVALFSAPEVAAGYWQSAVSATGAFTVPPPATHITGTFDAVTQPFDMGTTSSTGDRWGLLLGDSPGFSPLTLTPGASGTMHVSFTAPATTGTTVSGHLYVDTAPITGSLDELVAVPYEYTVG